MISENKVAHKQERQHIERMYWAGVLVWVGLVLVIDNQGSLPKIGEADAWSWVFFGAGLYGMLGNLYRLASPDWSAPTGWDYVWSGFWLIVGLGGVTTADIFWPMALVLVGVVSLANALFRRE